MAGHLFLVQSDLTRLSCDAWLLPCGYALGVVDDWLRGGPKLPIPRPPDDWDREGLRSFAWTGWPDELPQPWLTNVGARGRPVEWYVDGAVQFVRRAAEECARRRPRAGRARPLLGLPLIGTRHGGAYMYRGGVASTLLPALYDVLKEIDADLVLVLDQPEAMAACQRVRQDLETWSELTSEECRLADELAQHARESHLALFLGAGVSTGAGLPNWKELLAALTDEAGYDARLRDAVAQMSLLDQAELLARQMDASVLQQKVAQLVDVRHWSLTHSLLACLPCREAVTQNYDQLFEGALEAAGEAPSVLPYRPRPKKRWLLKMHGCVSHPQDIVLRRQDYLRYLERRGALAGLVQGLLLTRHLLFVGFSLTDDNFLAIVDDVRRARGPEPADELGTALFLQLAEPLRALWDDVRCVPLGESRRLDIFLDRVLHRAGDISRHLLDQTFHSLLSDSEKELKHRLLELEGAVGPEIRGTDAWELVDRLFRALGRPADK